MEEFVKNELLILENNCKDDEEALKMQKLVTKDIMEIFEIFRSQQHSGFSASYIIELLDRLLRYIPVSPLTGEDDEWNKVEYTDDICYQNKRCPSVFKDSSGKAYNVEGRAFSEDGGRTYFTNKDSRVYITFPYTVPLAPEYVIIDNKTFRDNILAQLLDILNNKGMYKGNDILKVTDNETLNDIMLEKDMQEYIAEIQKQYDIKETYIADKDTPLWSLVTYVLRNTEK